MPRRRLRMGPRKSFTVRLDEDDYDRLEQIAVNHEPPVSLTYMVEFAVKQMLKRIDGGQMPLRFESEKDDG